MQRRGAFSGCIMHIKVTVFQSGSAENGSSAGDFLRLLAGGENFFRPIVFHLADGFYLEPSRFFRQ